MVHSNSGRLELHLAQTQKPDAALGQNAMRLCMVRLSEFREWANTSVRVRNASESMLNLQME